MLPNFICIGPGRTGTSWLYEILLAHPQVGMAKDIKETEFFNSNFEKGLPWYEMFFKNCCDKPARGEISNRYFFHPEVAYRIKNAIKECKILIGMRNPYERMQSAYIWHLREGNLPMGCSFEDALKKMPALIYENQYYNYMKPYYELFSSKNIFLIFFDDIRLNPYKLCKKLFSFLNIDENFIPNLAEKKINYSIVPRFQLVSVTTKGVARLMRRMHLYKPLTWAKRADRLKCLLFKKSDYQKKNLLSPKIREIIDPILLPDIEKLEALIGMDLNKWESNNIIIGET